MVGIKKRLLRFSSMFLGTSSMRLKISGVTLLLVALLRMVYRRLAPRERVEMEATPSAKDYIRNAFMMTSAKLSARQDHPPPALRDGVAAGTRAARPSRQDKLGLSDSYRTGWERSSRNKCWFALGCCPRGDECWFSHSEDGSLTESTENGGSSSRNGSTGGRPLKKNDICSWYTLVHINFCSKGRNCKDAHGEEELAAWDKPVLPPGFPKPDGLAYFDSHCHLDGVLMVRNFGYQWPHKTKLCNDYMEPERWCHFADGGGCPYAHGIQERQKRPHLVREDLVSLATSFPPGFAGVLHNCCDRESIEDAVALVQWGREVLEGKIYVSFGLHPSDWFSYSEELERLFVDALERCGDRAVAWGECGLDYYRKPSAGDKIDMRLVFIRQVHIAIERDLPLIVHSRDAEEEVLTVLREHLPRSARLHLHSFSGSASVLAQILDEWPNSIVGFNGVVTYPTAMPLHELVRLTPLERLVLETDGPFMKPIPYRYSGGGSHPGHIPAIAQCVAELKGVPPDAVLAQTQANLCSMYGIAYGA